MEEQFLRNEMLWGAEAQRRLANSHVILFGLGGVGSYTAECLARSGVGELTIVDNDTVGLTNLNRRLEALHSTLGQRKTDAVAAVEIWPTPPASLDREPPKKLPKPMPKVVSARPVTFWLARRVMVSTL